MGRGQTISAEARFQALFGRGRGRQLLPTALSGAFGRNQKVALRRLDFLHWWLEDYGGEGENVITLSFHHGTSLESPALMSRETRDQHEVTCRADLVFLIKQGICRTNPGRGPGVKFYYLEPREQWSSAQGLAYAAYYKATKGLTS